MWIVSLSFRLDDQPLFRLALPHLCVKELLQSHTISAVFQLDYYSSWSVKMRPTVLNYPIFMGLFSLMACGPNMAGEAPSNTEELTLANCGGSYAAGIAGFYSTYFDCVDVSAASSATLLSTDGLPPHRSPYYPADNPNYISFDDRGGTHNQNPNELGVTNFSMTVADDPVAKGITIDASMVDNTMNTSDEEYPGGPVGVSINGVVIFAAMAAAGDDLADEQYTFDLFEGHPAGTTYHYHFESAGPLEVLVDRGLSASATPGSGSAELYGIMCDGTLVLGCTELDGGIPSDTDFDAQNGHRHDITDGSTTFFTNRYHTHVCTSRWPAYPFFPEIAFYEETNCR
jgi:hypothetical protein